MTLVYVPDYSSDELVVAGVFAACFVGVKEVDRDVVTVEICVVIADVYHGYDLLHLLDWDLFGRMDKNTSVMIYYRSLRCVMDYSGLYRLLNADYSLMSI